MVRTSGVNLWVWISGVHGSRVQRREGPGWTHSIYYDEAIFSEKFLSPSPLLVTTFQSVNSSQEIFVVFLEDFLDRIDDWERWWKSNVADSYWFQFEKLFLRLFSRTLSLCILRRSIQSRVNFGPKVLEGGVLNLELRGKGSGVTWPEHSPVRATGNKYTHIQHFI